MTTTTEAITIERVQGVMPSEGLHWLGSYAHKTEASAERAAADAVAAGYRRVIVQQVGAQRLVEGRSEAVDDHWVAAPGHQWFVWVDAVSHTVITAPATARNAARHATLQAERLARYAELLEQYLAEPPRYIMTGSRFEEDLRACGYGDLAAAAVAARTLDDLRAIVIRRNALAD